MRCELPERPRARMNTQGKVANSSQDVPGCDMPAELAHRARVLLATARASCWRVRPNGICWVEPAESAGMTVASRVRRVEEVPAWFVSGLMCVRKDKLIYGL